MKNFLILIAGYPGTGKSYLCKMILKEYPDFVTFSPDEVKEQLWDKYGFKNLDEKNKLINLSWEYYYSFIEKFMISDKNIISDYPFSDKQKNYLLNLSKKYNYKIITIRMTADLEILFKRQKTRDLDHSRHLGHILNKYDPKQKTIDRTHAEGLLSHDEFINRCLNRGYNKFQLGDLLTIDVSDFTTADYKTLLSNLNHIIKN